MFALRGARSVRPSASAALVCVLMVFAMGSYRYRPPEELWSQGGFDAEVKFEIAAWLGLGLLAGALMVARKVDLRCLFVSPMRWYVCLVVLFVVSAFYSPSPQVTAFRVGQIGVVLVLVAAARPSLTQVYLLICCFIALNWLVYMLGYRYVGDPTAAWRLGSVVGPPTQLGVVAAVGGAGLIARMQRQGEWRLWLGPFLLLATTAMLTGCRSAIAGLAGSVLVVLVLRRRVVALACIGLTVTAVMLPSAGPTWVWRTYNRGQTASQIRSVSGRDVILATALERSSQHALFGEGFMSGRAQLLVESAGGAETHAHNLWVDSYLAVGVVGPLLACVILASLCSKTLWFAKLPVPVDRAEGIEPLSMLIPVTLFCVTDSGFAAPVCPVVVLLVGFLSVLSRDHAGVLEAVRRGLPRTRVLR